MSKPSVVPCVYSGRVRYTLEFGTLVTGVTHTVTVPSHGVFTVMKHKDKTVEVKRVEQVARSG